MQGHERAASQVKMIKAAYNDASISGADSTIRTRDL